MLFDLSLAELRAYEPDREERGGFDSFGDEKEIEIHPLNGDEGSESIHAELKLSRLTAAARA